MWRRAGRKKGARGDEVQRRSNGSEALSVRNGGARMPWSGSGGRRREYGKWGERPVKKRREVW